VFHCRPIHLDKQILYVPGETKEEEEIKRTSSRDWMTFLLARSAEMKKGEYNMCLCNFFFFLIWFVLLCFYFPHGLQFIDNPVTFECLNIKTQLSFVYVSLNWRLIALESITFKEQTNQTHIIFCIKIKKAQTFPWYQAQVIRISTQFHSLNEHKHNFSKTVFKCANAHF
jgi:hypothetical protein